MENLKANSSLYIPYLPAKQTSSNLSLEEKLRNSNTLSQIYPNNLLGNFFLELFQF